MNSAYFKQNFPTYLPNADKRTGARTDAFMAVNGILGRAFLRGHVLCAGSAPSPTSSRAGDDLMLWSPQARRPPRRDQDFSRCAPLGEIGVKAPRNRPRAGWRQTGRTSGGRPCHPAMSPTETSSTSDTTIPDATRDRGMSRSRPNFTRSGEFRGWRGRNRSRRAKSCRTMRSGR
jgi:hypothetical protein